MTVLEDESLEYREELRRDLLADEDFRCAYAESFLNTAVAAQIKALREQREMTQADLARAIGTKQAGVSRLENVNYSAWKTGTLRKIARALKVRLKISFETFGTLLDEVESFNRESMRRETPEKDLRLVNPRSLALATASRIAHEEILLAWRSQLETAKGEETRSTGLQHHPLMESEHEGLESFRSPQPLGQPWHRERTIGSAKYEGGLREPTPGIQLAPWPGQSMTVQQPGAGVLPATLVRSLAPVMPSEEVRRGPLRSASKLRRRQRPSRGAGNHAQRIGNA